MTLGSLLRDAVQTCPADALATTAIVVQHEGVALRANFADRDRYSATLLYLEAGSAEAGAADDSGLERRVAALIERFNYLEEPLELIELDRTDAIALLRSAPPQRDAHDLYYWEIRLTQTTEVTATLARYRWSPGMPEREAIAYPATFPMIARLADSLIVGLE